MIDAIFGLTIGFAGSFSVYLGIGAVVLLRRFTCGSTIADVLAVADYYNRTGIRCLINYSPEDVMTEQDARRVFQVYRLLLAEFWERRIRGDISVKPSSLFAGTWGKRGALMFRRRAAHLLRRAHRIGCRVWFDEEHTADQKWVLPVLHELIFRHSNAGIVVRSYLEVSLQRAEEYVRWHAEGAKFTVRVCRGAYPEDAELKRDAVPARFLDIYRLLKKHGIPVVAATHTLVDDVLKLNPNPAVHMLHGRKEAESVLLPRMHSGRLSEAAVYLIFGPLWGRIGYGWRRVKEKPSLLFLWPWA